MSIFPYSRQGVAKEKRDALADVQFMVNERGNFVTINLRTETNTERDQFNSIKSRSTTFDSVTFRAYPIRYNPTPEYVEKVGLREQTQVAIHTTMKDWNDEGFTMEQLKDLDMVRMTCVIADVKYEIKDKALFSQFEDTYLYVVIGLNRI
jgi:hypothetical protein